MNGEQIANFLTLEAHKSVGRDQLGSLFLGELKINERKIWGSLVWAGRPYLALFDGQRFSCEEISDQKVEAWTEWTKMRKGPIPSP